MKKIEIVPPEGYEIDKDKSTFECIVFKEVAKLPMTWEEIMKSGKKYASYFPRYDGLPVKQIMLEEANIHLNVNTEQQAKKVIALAKLFIIMDEYNKREVRKSFYSIPIASLGKVKILIIQSYTIEAFPIYFHSEELFNEAYKHNKEIFDTFYLL
jgi:hypothetical protein